MALPTPSPNAFSALLHAVLATADESESDGVAARQACAEAMQGEDPVWQDGAAMVLEGVRCRRAAVPFQLPNRQHEAAREMAGALQGSGFKLYEQGDIHAAYGCWLASVTILKPLADADPIHEPDLAGSYCNLGLALTLLSRPAGAVTELLKAIAIHRPLADAAPRYEPYLANSYSNLGNALAKLGNPGEAVAEHVKAVAIRKQLAEADPRHEPDLAQSYSNLGVALDELGRPGEAVAEHVKAVAIRKRLAEADPRHEPDLATSYNNLGIAIDVLGHFGEAITEHVKAVAIRKRLAEADPYHEPDLAQSYNNLGMALGAIGRLDDSEVALRKAVTIFERVADANPHHAPDLANSYNNLGNALNALGRPSEAIDVTRSAVRIWEDWLGSQRTLTIEGTLAKAWMRLVTWLRREDGWKEADDELWFAVDALPFRREVLDAGFTFYGLFQKLSDDDLAAQGFTRDELTENVWELYDRLQAYHAGSWVLESARLLQRFAHGATYAETYTGLLGLAETWGPGDPRAWLRLGRFVSEHGPSREPARAAFVQAMQSARALLRDEWDRRKAEKPRYTRESLRTLLAALHEGGARAYTHLPSGAEHLPERQHGRVDIRDVLEAQLKWEDQQEPKDLSDWKSLREAIDADAHLDIDWQAKRVDVLEQTLQTFVGDVWPQVRRDLEALAEEAARTEMDDDTRAERVGQLLMGLTDTDEVRAGRAAVRKTLQERLHLDPEREPALHPVLTGLAVRAVLKDDPGQPAAVVVLLGLGLEGALRALLADPYLAAVAAGTAGPLADPSPLAGRVALGGLSIVWGKLVKHWDASPDVAALVGWLTDASSPPRHPELLRNPALIAPVETIKALRNRAAHSVGAPLTAEDADRVVGLMLDDPALLGTLYAACHPGEA